MMNKKKLSKHICFFITVFVLSIFGIMVERAHAACALPPSGLVSWWPGEGNAKDIVLASKNNGTLQGGTTFASGMVGQAFSFDGVNDYVSLPNADAYNFTTIQDFSIGVWVKYTGDGGLGMGDGAIVEKWSNVSGYPFVIRNSRYAGLPGQLYFAMYDGAKSVAAITIGTNYNDNIWHYVVGVHISSSKMVQIYIDGVLVNSNIYTNLGNTVNTSPLYFGRRGSVSQEWFGGLIDEVAIYNRALTADEIYAIYAAGSAGKCKCAGYAPTIIGTISNDTLTGTAGSDVILGLDGDDLIDGLGGTDSVCAGPGNDEVYGGDGNDYLFGEGGNDTLYGEIGQDSLNGGPGDDILDGGLDNSCNGGAGTDTAVNCINITNVP